MKLSLSKALLPAAALLAAATLGGAQIERLTLDQMVSRCDHAVAGQIVGKTVFRVDHPVDGPELYFTKLTVSGNSAYTGQEMTVDVLYHGGFVNDTEGVWNSEAPTDAETELGNDVLVFYKHSDNMGGDVAGNVLFAAHGGLYQTTPGFGGPVVLGRGDGYAVRNNVKLSKLETQMADIRTRNEQEKQQQKQQQSK